MYLKKLLGIEESAPEVHEDRKKLREAIEKNDRAGHKVEERLVKLIHDGHRLKIPHITER